MSTFNPGSESAYSIAEIVRQARGSVADHFSRSHVMHYASDKHGYRAPMYLSLRGNDAHRFSALCAHYTRLTLRTMVSEGTLEIVRREVPEHDLWTGKATGGITVLRTYHLTAQGRDEWFRKVG